ncbi:MAG: phosphoribosylanthranilate isomerase [Thermomicrobiales bacterium]
MNAEMTQVEPELHSLTRVQPLVKICGIRSTSAAIVATEFGADYLGFILAPSKRQIDIATVARIKSELVAWQRENDEQTLPLLTAVVVNLGVRNLREIASSGAVDVIQLSGDESPDILGEIDFPISKALRIDPTHGESAARQEIEAWLNHARPAGSILIDAWHPGAYGGTGLTADWVTIARLAADYPIWLAGGLTPENVASAISDVRPFGVDVSSGVETDGQKDVAKINAFLGAVGTTARS